MTLIFSPIEKYACAEREVIMRRKIFPRRIEIGRMSEDKAAREIAIMEAIANDYRIAAVKEQMGEAA